jgi:alpha-amylase
MFANANYRHPEMRKSVLDWFSWINETLGIAGVRLDAAKHYSLDFQRQFVNRINESAGKNFFVVSEYWKWDSKVLQKLVDLFDGRIRFFDVQLMYNFHDISVGKNLDLGSVFQGTLVETRPSNAVVSFSPCSLLRQSS